MVVPELIKSSMQYHERVFESKRRGEGAQAVRDMEEHIGDIEDRLSAYYQRGSGQ